MNRGDVRILFASTAKAGAGTNVQRRLVAEHHLDVPWRPSDLEQREGRIVRQGNLFYEEDPEGFEVQILRYATKQSYDSRMWQTIEHKAGGIEQFRRGDILQRVIDDVAGEAANAAEMKAAATGNPLIFLQVKLSADLKKLEALHANHKRGHHAIESRLAWLESADHRGEKAARMWDAEIARREPAPKGRGTPFRTPRGVYDDSNREGFLADMLGAMQAAIERRGRTAASSGQPERVMAGWYRGFEIQVFARRDQIQFCVHGGAVHEPENLLYWADDKFSAPGFLQRLDNFLDRFEQRKAEAGAAHRREKEELGRAKGELAKPFARQRELEDLRADVREVMAELKKMQGDDGYVSSWVPRSAGSEVSAASRREVPVRPRG